MSESRLSGSRKLPDHLANERTFLAWIRTAITIIALGFVVAKFGILLREIGGDRVHPLTVRAGKTVGVALVAGGLGLAGLAMAKFLRIHRDIERNEVHFSIALDVALAVTIGIISVVLAVYLIVTT